MNILSNMNGSRVEVNKLKGYFVYLFTILISIGTLLILLPLAYHIHAKYFVNKTYVDNKRLVYRGKILGIYLKFIIGYILLVASLTAINIGMYYLRKYNILPFQIASNTILSLLQAFFITRTLKIYVHKNTHFVSSKVELSTYEFHLFLLILTKLSIFIINTLTLNILYPVTTGIEDKYDAKRKIIDNYHFKYKARYRGYILKWLLELLLIVVTVLIWLPKALLDVYCWSAGNIHIAHK